MDAKKCDRCGKFYTEERLKVDNAVDIFDKKIYLVKLIYRGDNCSRAIDLDLCPCCMNDLKNFFEQPTELNLRCVVTE